MHKDEGIVDAWEELCSIPELNASRLRMSQLLKADELEAEGEESIVTTMKGSVRISIPGEMQQDLGEKDVCYLPMDSVFSIEASSPAEVIWARAPATKRHDPYVKRFAEITPVVSGAAGYHRQIFTSLGDKDPAERLIVGFVEGDEGNWTSFPPHKHDGKPEVYVYYGMGSRFGVQVVAGSQDRAFVVREGDAVLFEEGYHPNVATPGVGMNFVWIISAHPSERNLAVQFHPAYKDMPMGQTHLTTK